jgi:hypothetical protein
VFCVFPSACFTGVITIRRLRHTSSVQHQNSIQTFIANKTTGGIRFAVAVQSGCTNLGLGMLFRSNNQGSVNEGHIGCSQAAKPTQIRNCNICAA